MLTMNQNHVDKHHNMLVCVYMKLSMLSWMKINHVLCIK